MNDDKSGRVVCNGAAWVVIFGILAVIAIFACIVCNAMGLI